MSAGQGRVFRSIVITGASSGIGAELARQYAGPGVTLGLLGRDPTRLEGVAEACRSRGARVETGALDIREREAVQAWLSAFDAHHPVDLVVANAGVPGRGARGRPGEAWAEVQEVLDVNVYGTLASIHPFLERMSRRGQGQVVLVSSLAAYIGMPLTPAYSASKAAVRIYGEALRGALAPFGVGVTVACPGFVVSPMSERYPGPKPFLMSTDRAAGRIRRAAATNRARVTFPFPLGLGVWFLAVLPSSWNLSLQRRLGFY